MEQTHCTISEAAKKLHVEPHVLRYWEEELHLLIPRNQMGHRVYTAKEMETLEDIIRMKKDGYTLKEIESHVSPGMPCPPEKTSFSSTVRIEDENDRMNQFKMILSRIVSDAIRENSGDLTSDIASTVSDQVNKELDFLFREKEEADEKRFRQLDEVIRCHQKARQEAAAAQITPNKGRKRHKFGKK